MNSKKNTNPVDNLEQRTQGKIDAENAQRARGELPPLRRNSSVARSNRDHVDHPAMVMLNACLKHVLNGRSDVDGMVLPVRFVSVEEVVAVCMRDFTAMPGFGDRWVITFDGPGAMVLVRDATDLDKANIAEQIAQDERDTKGGL